MKRCSNPKCHQIKPLKDFSKNRSTKDGLSIYCKVCCNEKTYAWRKTPTGRKKHLKNMSIRRKLLRNKPAQATSSLKWSQSLDGKAKRNASNALRRAAKLHATPPWLTKEHKKQIKDRYLEAAKRTQETGIKHHVDHILPLQGETVSGLHVPWNLQILTAAENISKKNRT
jgi:hypothetical protein